MKVGSLLKRVIGVLVMDFSFFRMVWWINVCLFIVKDKVLVVVLGYILIVLVFFC